MKPSTKSQRLQDYEDAYRKEYHQMEQARLQRLQVFKAKHPDAVVLFRNVDTYVAYKSDAVVLAQICGLSLNRHVVSNDDVECAGFPLYRLDEYLPKLVHAGQRVAIAE